MQLIKVRHEVTLFNISCAGEKALGLSQSTGSAHMSRTASVTSLNHANAWILSGFAEKINCHELVSIVFAVCALVASVLTLTVISCYRFFGVVFAVRAQMTKNHAKIYISAIWIAAIAIASPLLVYREQSSRQWLNYREIWCDDKWPRSVRTTSTGQVVHDRMSRRIYYTFISTALYFIPCFIMSVAYIFIIVTLWSNKIPGEAIKSVQQATRRRTKKVSALSSSVTQCRFTAWHVIHIRAYMAVSTQLEHNNIMEYKYYAKKKHLRKKVNRDICSSIYTFFSDIIILTTRYPNDENIAVVVALAVWLVFTHTRLYVL